MRAKVLKLHPKTVEKLKRLKKESEKDGAYRVSKRLHAVLLNHDGNTSGEISSLLQIPRSCVTQWLSHYEQYGHEGLLEGHRSGRPAGLSDSQKKELADIVESGPVAYGFLSGVWTAVMIGHVIQNEFDIEYDARHVRRILDGLGFSVQRPKRLLANADPVKQNRWIRHIYPQIKKKPKH
jgi:transposase